MKVHIYLIFSSMSVLLAMSLPTNDLPEDIVSRNNQKQHEGHKKVVREFKSFMKRFNKSYTNRDEENERREIFAENLQNIQRLNDDYYPTSFAVNEYADISWDEFKLRLRSFPPTVSPTDWVGPITDRDVVKLTEAPGLPNQFSWRSKGYVSPVKNQETCSGGWVFATIAVAEIMARKQNKSDPLFSEQQLLDCVDRGCSGGDVRHAFGYFQDVGVVAEDVVPFRGMTTGNCLTATSQTRLNTMRDVARDEFRMAYSIRDGGPLAVTFKVGRSFQFYESGILIAEDCNEEKNIWHSVAVTGFGNGYWEIKNSFGTSWGTGGFGQVKRGSNWCHIEDGPTSGWL